MNILQQFFNAELTIAGHQIFWREIVGNGFGFASAIGGMRRRVWAWPVGIVGNVILFTVFFGVAFANPQGETLYGQAGGARSAGCVARTRWTSPPSVPGGRRRGNGSCTSASGSVVWWSCSGCSP